MKTALCTLFALLFLANLLGQDLSNLKNQKPFSMSGGLSVRGGFYSVPDGQTARRSPSNWAISGSPTFTFYGLTVPLSFTYSDQKLGYSQPFQRFGASPRWKWLTVHAGYRNMTFSPYTLAGHTFLGGGLEINRKKIRFSTMYGNLQNAIIQSDTAVLGSQLLDTYRRRAYGAKLGLGTAGNHVDFIAFRAFDKIGTENLPAELRESIHPADNIALGVEVLFTFFKRLQFESSVGASIVTRDQNFFDHDSFGDKRVEALKRFSEKFMTTNLSTRLGFAGDAALRLNFPKWQLGVKYQRIEPNYTSLGAYYFQDDVENRTVNAGFRLFRGKISVDGSVGQQRNNLMNLRLNSANRLIGNGSVTILPSPRWGISAQYSNFRSEQTPTFQNVADTFRFVQVSQMVSLSPFFNKSSKRFSHSVTVNLSQQVFDDLSEGASVLPQNSNSQNAFFNYRVGLKKTGWRVSLGANFNKFETGAVNSARYGVTTGLGRPFFKKKMDANLSSTFNIATNSGPARKRTVQNHRLSTNWKIGKKQSLNFSVLWLHRALPGKPKYSEKSGSVGYSFRF